MVKKYNPELFELTNPSKIPFFKESKDSNKKSTPFPYTKEVRVIKPIAINNPAVNLIIICINCLFDYIFGFP